MLKVCRMASGDGGDRQVFPPPVLPFPPVLPAATMSRNRLAWRSSGISAWPGNVIQMIDLIRTTIRLEL
jgi:hypothetical protein